MTSTNKHTVAINVYDGRWTLLDDLRVVELTDQELFDLGENWKLAVEAAANRGRRVAPSATVSNTEPAEPVDWNVL
jgi:hypothetical protein